MSANNVQWISGTQSNIGIITGTCIRLDVIQCTTITLYSVIISAVHVHCTFNINGLGHTH